MSALSLLALGLLLGVQHACDADHVAAVAAIVGRHQRLSAAWPIGAAWGLGHAATVFIAGGAIVLLRVAIPERLSLGMEFTVGLMLMGLGALNVLGLRGGGVTAHAHRHDHAHEHAHGGHGTDDHPHLHVPTPSALSDDLRPDEGRAQLLRAACVGIVHGLAGSAAVALLALGAIADRWTGLVYLALFGLGTIVGMLSLSALMAYSLSRLARWWRAGERGLALATGLLSLGIGLRLAYQTALAGGLF